jgi:hypothetical protein
MKKGEMSRHKKIRIPICISVTLSLDNLNPVQRPPEVLIYS